MDNQIATTPLPKKKRHILRWIFNILCLLVISFLFAVGVWTRNLNLLWLIIPIALWIAAFKRKIAGWLALGFLATIAGIVVWLFLPNSGNWRPYNFDYELKDLEAKRAVPDSENAAIAYQKIFAHLDVNNPPPFYDEDCNGPSTSVPWKGADHPETAAFIDTRNGLITEAMAASRMKKCAFPAWTDPLNILDSSFREIRQVMYLVISAANRDLGEDRISNAIDKYTSVILMARQLEQQPITIYFLTGLAIEGMGIDKLKYVVIECNSTPDDSRTIRDLFAATDDDWPMLWSTMSQHEKMLAKNTFVIAYEINNKDNIRFSRNIPVPDAMAEYLKYKPTVLERKMAKLAAIGYWFVLPHDPRVLGTMYDKSFEEANRTADANHVDYSAAANLQIEYFFCHRQSTMKKFAQSEADSSALVHQIYLRYIAYRRAMHILVALREYKNANGRGPDTLDQVKNRVPAEAMIDPFTGGSFVYKVKNDKFLLYSVGPNKIDEKCVPRPYDVSDPNKFEEMEKKMRGKFDDVLIWPQKNEQAKEFFDANMPAVK